MKIANATIRWIGQTPPACGATYSSVSRWDEQADDESWSVVVDIGDAASTGELVARIRFLMDEAPQQLLHVGSRFELYEGATKVATGEVTSDVVDAPWRPAFVGKAARVAS